jgi:hypothetical protein
MAICQKVKNYTCRHCGRKGIDSRSTLEYHEDRCPSNKRLKACTSCKKRVKDDTYHLYKYRPGGESCHYIGKLAGWEERYYCSEWEELVVNSNTTDIEIENKTKWICEHCKDKSSPYKQSVIDHEKNCLFNPENKACQTCIHGENYQDEEWNKICRIKESCPLWHFGTGLAVKCGSWQKGGDNGEESG